MSLTKEQEILALEYLQTCGTESCSYRALLRSIVDATGATSVGVGEWDFSFDAAARHRNDPSLRLTNSLGQGVTCVNQARVSQRLGQLKRLEDSPLADKPSVNPADVPPKLKRVYIHADTDEDYLRAQDIVLRATPENVTIIRSHREPTTKPCVQGRERHRRTIELLGSRLRSEFDTGFPEQIYVNGDRNNAEEIAIVLPPAMKWTAPNQQQAEGRIFTRAIWARLSVLAEMFKSSKFHGPMPGEYVTARIWIALAEIRINCNLHTQLETFLSQPREGTRAEQFEAATIALEFIRGMLSSMDKTRTHDAKTLAACDEQLRKLQEKDPAAETPEDTSGAEEIEGLQAWIRRPV